MFQRSSVIVEGPLAARMQRLAATRASAVGREIFTLPQLAARLAGGFCALAGPENLYPAIRQALAQGGFAELANVRDLPGTPRAVARSLALLWRADLDLAGLAADSSRLADLLLVERRVREALPPGRLLPRELRDAALARLAHAPSLFGVINISGLIDIDTVWRPLIAALTGTVEITWNAPADGDRSWFPGLSRIDAAATPPVIRAELCADPPSEAVEALRWARELLSRGTVAPSDVAITTTSPDVWDHHLLVLSIEAKLPVHFSHGVPALSTRDGQACAALADILTNGINQQRVRRLIRRLPTSDLRNRIPTEWSVGLPRDAGLFTIDQWRRAFTQATAPSPAAAPAHDALLTVLELISQGPAVAAEAGKLLLSGQSRFLWEEALRIAPAEAVQISLESLRVPDSFDPGNSIVWCPAAHLAASPRPWVRLLGMTSGSWPRAESEDPILPDHKLSRRVLEPLSVTERDRRDFEVIKAHASSEFYLSRSRRSSQGSLQSPSALWPSTGEHVLSKTRIPQHAYSEADRVLARPEEAAASARVTASRQCWRNWHQQQLTPHDGPSGASSAAIERALARVQSTTSIRRLLRDPIGFVWRYALGWRSSQFEQQPLTLPPPEFGELVHELIRRTIHALEPDPGFSRASEIQIRNALDAAVTVVAETWPVERAVPPDLLWRHTLDEAALRTFRGLTVDEALLPGTRSWTELPFGDDSPGDGEALPWNSAQPVLMADTSIRFGGRIDRLDLRPSGDAARLSDYKSGQPPKNAANLVLGRGAELQRVLYAMAARQLLPDTRKFVSRLVYLAGETAPFELRADALDQAIVEVAHFVTAAAQIVRNGWAVPGPDAHERFHDMRLALPADCAAYLHRKQQSFALANKAISALWSRP